MLPSSADQQLPACLQAIKKCKDDERSMGHARRFFGPGELPPDLPVGFRVDTRGQAFVGGLATTLMSGIETERGKRPKNYIRKAVSIFVGACSRVWVQDGLGFVGACSRVLLRNRTRLHDRQLQGKVQWAPDTKCACMEVPASQQKRPSAACRR